ncbi:hypothetical protein ABW19_dt0204044 [Dactylella cylindrospora]|nr:hypothetical protein ABW19_dt0204044 [Dactylella cylindrospora]
MGNRPTTGLYKPIKFSNAKTPTLSLHPTKFSLVKLSRSEQAKVDSTKFLELNSRVMREGKEALVYRKKRMEEEKEREKEEWLREFRRKEREKREEQARERERQRLEKERKGRYEEVRRVQLKDTGGKMSVLRRPTWETKEVKQRKLNWERILGAATGGAATAAAGGGGKTEGHGPGRPVVAF